MIAGAQQLTQGIDKSRPENIPLADYLSLVEDFLSRLTGVLIRRGKANGAHVRALLTQRIVENQRVRAAC